MRCVVVLNMAAGPWRAVSVAPHVFVCLPSRLVVSSRVAAVCLAS